MKSFQEKAEILCKEKLGEDIYRYTLQAPKTVAVAQPGQFVMIRVTDGYDPLLRRPFSIHQITEEGLLQILFKVVGKGTDMMASFAQGQVFDLIGPLGKGFSVNGSTHICLLGGGMGIAPLLFFARNLHQMSDLSEVTILLGAQTRTEVEIFTKDFEGFGFSVRTATDDGTIGHHGLVTDLLADLVDHVNWNVYACGPYPMMRTAVKQCDIYGWRCQVSLETIMACGVAACLGCAVPKKESIGYVHACKDGPVFEAEELLWL